MVAADTEGEGIKRYLGGLGDELDLHHQKE